MMQQIGNEPRMWYRRKSGTVDKAILTVAVSTFLVLALILSGCGKSQAADEPETTAAPSVAVKSTPTTPASTRSGATSASTQTSRAATTKPTATSAAAATALPKLTDVSFALTLDPQQEYTEYTTSIYLKSTQTLHLTWVVIKGSDHFYMSFTLPDGRLIAVRSTGSLAALSPGSTPNEKLVKSGNVVFRPDNNDWQDGYYIFHPQIFRGDPAVTVKLLYWVEG
jgi:hypothetical protein